MSSIKRERSVLELAMDVLKTADLRMRLAPELGDMRAHQQMAIAELEEVRSALATVIQGLKEQLKESQT